jgi:hypothetical protein
VHIRGIEGLTTAEVEAEVQAGGRFVFFECCISLLFVTWRRPSSIYLLRKGERGLIKALPHVLLTLILGWWGIPWGLVYTPRALLTNLGGGHDVTAEACALLRASGGHEAPVSERGGGS